MCGFVGIMSDNSDQTILDEPEFETMRHQAMAFERMFDMPVNFESYVDHVQRFPERVKDFARGGRSPQGLGEWFDEPTSEHSDGFHRATMLMNPRSAASAVMQWMQNPKLKEGNPCQNICRLLPTLVSIPSDPSPDMST